MYLEKDKKASQEEEPCHRIQSPHVWRVGGAGGSCLGAQYLTGRSVNTVLRVELNADAVPWTF